MKKIYITIAGMQYYDGGRFVSPGMVLRLKKDPKNRYDTEAVKAELPIVGKAGFVANSTNTVLNGTYSAGRLYDLFGKKCYARVLSVKGTRAIAIILKGKTKKLKKAWKKTLVKDVYTGPQSTKVLVPIVVDE